MKRRIAICSWAAAAAVSAVLAFPLTSGATTVDDVAAVARQYGYSEDIIMQGYNEYYKDPDYYTSDDFDAAIEWIRQSGSKLITTGSQVTVTTTSAATTTTVTTTAPSGNKEPSTEPPEAAAIVLTDNSGNTFTRISTKEFIKLSYDEKMAYLRTFTPEQQQIIIDNLSPEEYRSLLKQAPQDKKISVVDDLSKAADAMGMNITIDEISDDSISVAMRNDDGELIGVANAGMIVEDTGYDRSSIFRAAGALFVLAAAGVLLLVKKCFGKERIGEENDKQ
ncbi:MAG: hypothetical protein IKO47_01730 [Ruminococcus sp.]|nr:hypothetical protein [Ruminococcus sp.]